MADLPPSDVECHLVTLRVVAGRLQESRGEASEGSRKAGEPLHSRWERVGSAYGIRTRGCGTGTVPRGAKQRPGTEEPHSVDDQHVARL